MNKIISIIRTPLRGLRGRILAYILLSSIVPLVIALVTFYLVTRGSMIEVAGQTMINQVNYITSMCQLQSESIDREATSGVNRAHRALLGNITRFQGISLLKESTTEKVINQETAEEHSIAMPVMASGGTRFIRNYGIVDRIVSDVGIPGATATVFQLMMKNSSASPRT